METLALSRQDRDVGVDKSKRARVAALKGLEKGQPKGGGKGQEAPVQRQADQGEGGKDKGSKGDKCPCRFYLTKDGCRQGRACQRRHDFMKASAKPDALTVVRKRTDKMLVNVLKGMERVRRHARTRMLLGASQQQQRQQRMLLGHLPKRVLKRAIREEKDMEQKGRRRLDRPLRSQPRLLQPRQGNRPQVSKQTHCPRALSRSSFKRRPNS